MIYHHTFPRTFLSAATPLLQPPGVDFLMEGCPEPDCAQVGLGGAEFGDGEVAGEVTGREGMACAGHPRRCCRR